MPHPLSTKNGDQCLVVCPSDLFVRHYSNLTRVTLELSRWLKRKLRAKSARRSLQLMATREDLTERKIPLRTRTSTLMTS